MQAIERTPAGYEFCSEIIGRRLAPALALLAELGADECESIEVRGSGRPIVCGALRDLAGLAERRARLDACPGGKPALVAPAPSFDDTSSVPRRSLGAYGRQACADWLGK